MKTSPQKMQNDVITEAMKTGALQLAQSRFRKRLSLKPQSFLSVEDLSPPEMKQLIQTGIEMKKNPHDFRNVMRDKSVALLFQKTSTRTRCSFENAAIELGAFPGYIDWRTSNFVLADLRDEIIVLSRYYDMIVARVLEHETLVTMAGDSEVAVINGMCNLMHPCQSLSDFLTVSEYFGPDLTGLKIAYLGDGNNVCRSLVHGAINLGVKMALCSPNDYRLDKKTVDASEGLVEYVEAPADAVRNADIIYTDTWISIGDEGQTEKRLAAFHSYQVNSTLMEMAPKHALFMHCLPAHPGQEVSAEVLRSPRSVVFDQAENRKHAQKALMKKLSECGQ